MNFRHFLLSTLIIFCSSLPVKADHGGALDMSYRCLGGGKYEITLKFYRDCSGAAMISSYSAFLDTYYGVGANIDIDWSSSCGSGTITFPKPTNVTAATNYVGPEVTFLCPTGKSTCNGGTTPGFQYYEYIDTITLGTCTGNITFGYGVCNRSCSINTIITPCSSCAYVDAMLNNSGGCNSSPVFSNVPLPVACVGQKFCFNPGAIDADGDSLVYSLINARGGTSVSSSWTDVVTYMPPYSGTNPIATSGGVTINKTTGDICFTPTTQQIGVIAIQVDEYRNKKKVGYVVRDMQIYIKACTNNMPIMSGIDNTTSFSTTACKDSPICFDVFSSDADAAQNVSISWNNGIPGATFTSSGGSRPKGTFCWTPTAANVRPSPYVFTVTVKDDNCPNVGVQVFTYQINVTNCVGPQVNITSASVCSGGCTNITANTSGGATPYTYNWSGGGSTTSVLNVCPTATTTYSVTVTDNSGATKTAAATVTVSSPMTLTTSKVDSKCSGANNGTATALPTGGSTPLTYSWSTTPVQTTITATNLAPGTYIVTTTDSKGCTKTSTAVITEPPAVTLTPSSTNTSCNGSADGTASVIPNGGSGPYTYTWAPSGGAGQTATSLPAATYTVTVTDSKGCTKSATTAVAQPSAINLSLSKTDIKCNGGSTGTLSVNVNGGSSPYSYSWSPAGGNGATASSLLVGTYTVVVTDTKGCTTSSSSSITEPAAMSLLTNSSPANCGVNDGSVGVTPNGGISPYTYLWTPGGGSTAIISNVAGGSYTVLVTDSKGCSTSTTAIVASSGGATITATSTNVTCYNGNDGTASAAATGGTPGYAYSWSNGATSQTVSGLISGTYSVTVTDANNCPAISTTVITQPSAVTGTVSVVSSTCGNPNGSATVTPNGGQGAYSFSWSSGGVTATESGLSATTYTVTVFDGSACTGTASATITNVGGGVPTASVVTNVTCNGGNDGSATVNIAGGTIPFTYSWSSAQNTQTISGLTQGSYTVTIGDASTCTSTSVVTITEPAAINDPTFVTNNANCGVNNGSAIASASGGAGSLTYTWSNSVAGPTNNNIAANSYTVTVKDANGCTKTGVANVSNNGGPTVNSITPTAVTCNGAKTGSVTVNISSGNPSYTYSWSEGTNSTTTDVQSTISNVAAG
ncbi:MAG: SprB repeat-containing protein, partial [Bacteroidia bacterium]|nr:SprB repeat-containing protein [Bacteroidia bacterium]